MLHVDVRPPPSHRADIRASYDLGGCADAMPRTSRFCSLDEARGFLVELYTAFGHDPRTGAVRAVTMERGHWAVRIVDDRRAGDRFIADTARFPAGSAHLDSIFHVEQVPYLWHTLQRR